MKALYLLLQQVFKDLDFLDLYARLSAIVVTFLAIVVLAMIVHWVTKFLVVKIIHRLVEKTKTDWDDYLLKRKVFASLSHLTSAIVFYYSANFSEIEHVTRLMTILTNIYFVVIFIKVASGVLKASNDIYLTTPYAATRSIKGYIQLAMIMIYFIAGIFIIAIIFDKSPLYLLGGLSAIAAVLLIVFKDTILGLVASIQLSANKMLKPGDWIEMPKYNADGTVIDISLNTVKVQNGDKTITTIPTYSLVSDAFLNWAGVDDAGGRRIKRSINIDMKSVRFCDEKMLEKFSQFDLIKNYISEKQAEINEHNQKAGIKKDVALNGRHQTNLGIFRKYLEEYLRNNPSINTEMTLVVRHLQPKESGLPIEIYVFSKQKQLYEFEAVQADLFDHILAAIPEFGLRVFQAPSGGDINDLTEKLAIKMN
ncbi:MAG TPA: mechanosensitive ion channel [Prolixibacteraceae bacterium]|nr:mechanosensitive ion channel [Prolixibacteraceae bacterium]HPR84560.1 mechanosensitive ion channel [Prolixibacteraceae bacterium]